MKAPGTRTSFALLVLLTAVSWALPIWEATQGHGVSIVSVVTAAMFGAMLLVWPFVTGTRVSRGHLQKARMCVECRSLRWPTEDVLGFCLMCGSVRASAPAGY